MKMQTKFTSLSLGLVASLVSAAAPAQAPACKQPQYTVTDLGALGKGNYATSNDMNSIGWVAGQSNLVPKNSRPPWHRRQRSHRCSGAFAVSKSGRVNGRQDQSKSRLPGFLHALERR